MGIFLLKVLAFFILGFVLSPIVEWSGIGGAERNSVFVNFFPMAISFFIVFFIPSMIKKGKK